MGHTPGPWRMEAALNHIKIWGEREKTGCVLIAEVRNEHDAHSTLGKEEHANALLYAAAPRLLAACEVVIAHRANDYLDNTIHPYSLLVQAISEAKGDHQ